MHQKDGILEDPKTTVFYSGFKMHDPVKCTTTNRTGTITKIWGKEVVHKDNGRITVHATFDYTVTPEVKSYNSFRCKEVELLINSSDAEGNELLLPADVYHGR